MFPVFEIRIVIVLLVIATIVCYNVIHVKRSTPAYSEYWKNKGEVTASTAAENLPKSGRLFCWVLTGEAYYNIRVPAVNATWLKRCDHGEFFVTSPLSDNSIPYRTIFAGMDDSYGQLFYKTIEGFWYAYHEISKDFDWYFKADDDTYLMVDNLKDLLKHFDPEKPYYIGYLWDHATYGRYHSGGSGYALSKAALKLFVEQAYRNPDICPFDANEDAGLARCLRNLGIEAYHSEKVQETFVPLKTDDFQLNSSLVSIHYRTPAEMHILDKYFYNKQNN